MFDSWAITYVLLSFSSDESEMKPVSRSVNFTYRLSKHELFWCRLREIIEVIVFIILHLEVYAEQKYNYVARFHVQWHFFAQAYLT